MLAASTLQSLEGPAGAGLDRWISGALHQDSKEPLVTL